MKSISSSSRVRKTFSEEQNASLKMLLQNVTYKYFLENSISSEYMDVVESKVLLRFYEGIDNIQNNYKGKAQLSSYYMVVMIRMIRDVVNRDLKLVETAS